jgi:hypothetical protein
MARVRNTFWKKQIDKLIQSENIPVVFKKYINFNTIGGETGYGFRDEAGNIQWKNDGGTWQNIGTGGGGGGHTIEDEGAPLTTRTKLNFVGAGVTVTDDSGDDATVVTIPGGSGASPLTTKGDIYTYSTTDARLPSGLNGQILTADSVEATGLKWVYPETAGTLTFMLANVASDISTYYDAVSLPAFVATTIGDISTAGVSTTPTILGVFATESGYPGVTTVPSGLFHLHYETEKVAGSNNYYTYAEIYKRNLAGTETLLLTSDSSSQSALNTVVQHTVGAFSSSEITLLDTDRIIVKIYGVMLSSTATIHLYFDDNTDARMEVPSLSVDASNFVPYTGATADVNIGAKTFTASDVLVGDDVYGAGWNGSLEVPTKNAVYDKIEGLSTVYAPVLGVDDNYVTDAEKAALHTAVTVTDSTSIDFTLTGQDITAQREALTGAITAPKNSNTTSLGSFTKTELSGAVSDGDVMYIGDAPTAHTHFLAAGATDVTATATELNYVDGVTSSIQTQLNAKEATANKGVSGGYASLDGGGKVPTSQLPALALTDVFTVASQVAQLALTAEEGDVAIRTDLNKSYVHNGGVAGTMADWSELLTPTDTVLSVNGEVGAVTLTSDDISDTAQTNKWSTAAEKTKLGHISVTQAVDLDALETASHTAVTVTDSTSIDITLTGQDITAQREALTGAITAPKNSNTTSLGSFTVDQLNTAISDADVATGGGTATGTNTGDQTTIVGITGTKAEFDTAVTDGNFLYVGDVVSNATHTGEVTGSGALTVDKTAITNKTTVTPVSGDFILVSDTSDGGNLKKANFSDFGGGGGTTASIYIDQTPDNGTYGLLAGTVNGSNTVFTVAGGAYTTGKLAVYLNGQLLTQGASNDYQETTPASGTFTFITAPVTGSIVTAVYQKDITVPASIAGQATVDFGASTGENSIARITVSTASATTTSIIVVSPSGAITADHDTDDYQWDNISGYASNIVDGVSFDIVGVAPNGSWGEYIFNYIIN